MIVIDASAAPNTAKIMMETMLSAANGHLENKILNVGVIRFPSKAFLSATTLSSLATTKT